MIESNVMLSDAISITEVSLSDAYRVHERIPEFAVRFPYSLQTFFDRTTGRETIALIATADEKEAGYLVGYDRDLDGSFYCWMTGVDPDYRRRGILQALMIYLEGWARQKGYTLLKIKTRNHRREMLSFLTKNDFLFIDVEKHDDVMDNRILLQKAL